MSNTTSSSNQLSLHFTHPFLTKELSELLISFLPKYFSPIIVLCIGTDRSTGDSLGPLTGTFLHQLKPKHLKVYGTLHKPVHALNLEETIKSIHNSFENPYIIAVDASLGRSQSIGHITSNYGPLLPGAAFNKQLPEVGHAHITGIVNISGMMEYNVLQSTKLSLVYDMARIMSRSLLKIEYWLTHSHPYLNTKMHAKRPSFKINGQYI